MLTQKSLEDLSYRVIKCMSEVNNHLGPGLLESVYQAAMMYELFTNDIEAVSFPLLPVHYKGKMLEGHFRPDIVVNDCLIIELKAVEFLNPVHKAQLLTYLKLSGMTKGLLVNFNAVKVKDQINSMVTPGFFELPGR